MVIIVSQQIVQSAEKLVQEERALSRRLMRTGYDPSCANDVLVAMDVLFLTLLAQHHMLLDETASALAGTRANAH